MPRHSAHCLLIFDCDGVLVDSEVVAASVLARELTALGWPMTAQTCIARYTGLSMPAVIARIEAEWGRMLPVDFMEHIRTRDAEAFRTELKAMPGIADVLTTVTGPKCVASSGRLVKMRLTLSLTGLIGFFEPHLFSAEMVSHGKPAPDLFLFAAARMGAAPSDCLVIEDSLAGIEAARAAGMRVLGFAGGSHCSADHARHLQDAGAAAVITAMAELPTLLSELSGTTRTGPA